MTKRVRRPAAKPKTFSERDLKSLKALFKNYGADLIETELKRIAQGPPLKEAGAPQRIYPGSYVAVYLNIEERRQVMRPGKVRKRLLSVSKASEELANDLNICTSNAHYAASSLREMHRKGRKLVGANSIPAPYTALVTLRDGREMTVPCICEMTPEGLIRSPTFDGLGQGGRD